MSILIAHPGTQHVHHLVRGMINAGQSLEYHTSLAFGEGYPWQPVWPKRLFRRRRVVGIPDSCIRRQPMMELVPTIRQWFGSSMNEAYAERNKLFQMRIPDRAIANSSSIVGFDTSSYFLAARAKEAGIPFFLELTTPHSKEKLKWIEFIRNNYPDWPTDSFEKSEVLMEREDAELRLSNYVSVPSAFVQNSHVEQARSQAKFVTNPYGIDLAGFYPKQRYFEEARFCYMGGANAAKGAPILIEAWQRANPHAELTMAGHGTLPANVKLPKNVRWVGSVPKSERVKFYHSFDVLICPSLYEGLAIAQLEAAACGLAVVGTSNSGGAEVLTNKKSGWFTPAGDVTALAEVIALLSTDRALRHGLGQAAAIQAKTFSWDSYVLRWLHLIKSHSKR